MYLQRYQSFIKANLSQKPPCLPDAERFAKLHSWYKHLSPIGTVFYAYLQRGEQPRYDFDLSYTTKDQYLFHWHFVRAEDCGKVEISLDDEHMICGFSDDITVFLSKFPIVLNNNFGCGPLDHSNRYDEIERITTKIWDNLMKPVKIVPPTLRTRQSNPTFWGKQLLQHVRIFCTQAYEKRDHQTVKKFIEQTRIPDVDNDLMNRIASQRWEYYSIMGILQPEAVEALTDAIQQNRVGLIDFIEVFGDEGMVADGARKLMQKVMGEKASAFNYMSYYDFVDVK
uniref:Uncharacterized protein n=1 Tax=Clandestinovirus TaxID=2831644 RepID=A0A8F8KQW3_9VIRU|nr:hypothetical protein KOM_12_92 [Clandestinovirus]